MTSIAHSERTIDVEVHIFFYVQDKIEYAITHNERDAQLSKEVRVNSYIPSRPLHKTILQKIKRKI